MVARGLAWGGVSWEPGFAGTFSGDCDEIWGTIFRDRNIQLHCDNMGVVQVINQVTASSVPVVRLLWYLVLSCLQ